MQAGPGIVSRRHPKAPEAVSGQTIGLFSEKVSGNKPICGRGLSKWSLHPEADRRIFWCQLCHRESGGKGVRGVKIANGYFQAL